MPVLLIDATALTDRPKGVGKYTYHLIEQISRRLPEQWILHAVTFKDYLGVIPGGRAKQISIPYSSDFIKGLLRIPDLLSKLNVDVLLSPNESILLTNVPIKRIVVLHDFNEEIWRHQYSFHGILRRPLDIALQKLRTISLRKSDVVVCNSQFVSEGAVSRYAVPTSKIRIGYCGIDPRFYNGSNDVGLKAQLGWDGYVLSFATGDPRENFIKLPDIWKEVARKLSGRGLIVAGVDPSASYAENLSKAFARNGLKEGQDFVFHGFYDDKQHENLVALYTNADFYLELSAHEGFGMQLAEAMATGTTCLSTGCGALSEVGGGYPIAIDPEDSIAIGRTIAEAYTLGLHNRDNTAQVSYTRRYSWDAVGALLTMEIQYL